MQGNLHPAQYFGLGGALWAALALWALYRCFRNLWRNRLVSDTPRARIRSAAQGYVKLDGRAAALDDKPLLAPLSARPCVWWRYKVEHQRRRDTEDSAWETIDSGTSVDLFILAQGKDKCLVGPVSAEITPTLRDVWYGSRLRPVGPPGSSAPKDGEFRYTEEILRIGDPLSVLGELRAHAEIGDAEDSTGALLRQWKQDQGKLLARFDRDRDGRLDATEWETARQAAEAESQTRARDARIHRLNVISQPRNGEPFLVASMDDATLVLRERLHAALFFVLGLVCVVLCASAMEHARIAAEAARRGLSSGADLPIEDILWPVLCAAGVLASRLRARVV